MLAHVQSSNSLRDLQNGSLKEYSEFNYNEKTNQSDDRTEIGHIRILGIELELACN